MVERMRNYLRWMVLGTVVAISALASHWILGAGREVRYEPKPLPTNVSAIMASYGYKKSGDNSQSYVGRILGAEHYFYCPTEQDCNTAAGNAAHPPVDIYGDAAVEVEIWWPPALPAKDSPLAGKRLTICTYTPEVISSARITNDEWAKNVASLSQAARSLVTEKMAASPQRLPAAPGDEQVIPVNGWQCPVPAGVRPFR
jgi:hypothetical protein